MPELRLAGCTPEPLMGYLKALGVFRLVAEDTEHGDPAARLSWKGGAAHLASKFDRGGLVRFFLDEYKPTPVMTPWNSASGFAPTKAGNKAPKDKAAREAVESIAGTTSLRFEAYRRAIQDIRHLQRGDENAETWKQDYFMRCRANLADAVVGWLDACFALTGDSLPPFPLLGSGGNDGVTDFGSLFMQRLKDVLIAPPNGSTPEQFLNSSLYAGTKPDGQPDGACPPALMQDTVGQFNPRGIGGANAIQGKFEAKSEINPWDYVLMIEGAVLFAGSVARRLGMSTEKAVFPFTVESIVVGNGSFCEKEARTQGKEPPNSGELWLPLWGQAISFGEMKHLFREGRAQFGRRQANNSVEFALAVCTLGTNRGIDSFVRYGFLRRNGKAFLATPLGRFEVEPRPKANLLNDAALTTWVDKLRDACRENDGKKEKVPARYKLALRGIDRAMFAFANRSQTDDSADAGCLLEVLRAIGRVERTLANGLRFTQEKYLRPTDRLSEHWLTQADDGSAEFRLSVGLAGIRSTRKNEVGPIRVFLEEVKTIPYLKWSPGSTSAVWSARPLADNLAAVFRRRQLEAFREGVTGVPLDSVRPTRLEDMVAFLTDPEFDDGKLHDLIWALVGIDWSAVETQPPEPSTGDRYLEVPFEFGLPRLVVQPRLYSPFNGYWQSSRSAAANAAADPEVFYALASGRANAVTDCVDRAARRLKSGGLLAVGYQNRRRAGTSLAVQSPFPPTRLLAAMLFPLAEAEFDKLANAVLNYPEATE